MAGTFIPILGKRIRITTLDKCGLVPEPGTENAFLATDGFVSVNLSAEVEQGTEIITRKADGSLCVNERQSPTFKRFNIELTLCGVNTHALTMMTNAEPYLDYDDAVSGFTVPEGKMEKKFALEIWTGLAGIACGEGGDEASGYVLLPYIQSGAVGNIEIAGENAVNFSITGAYTIGGNSWETGPYEVVKNATGEASKLPTALDPLDHLLLMDTALALPPSADDPAAMPAA